MRFLCAAAILSSVFCGATRATKTGQPIAFTVSVMTPPVADVLAAAHAVLMSDGHNHLVYELRLSNVLDGRFDLKRLVVLNGRLRYDR